MDTIYTDFDEDFFIAITSKMSLNDVEPLNKTQRNRRVEAAANRNEDEYEEDILPCEVP